ncbi:MAG: hypothetical protein LM580_10005 [Thermofilum sp.]|nr:hypothetical protein [Thermofilum sp.]
MLRASQALKRAEELVRKAIPLYVVNALLPPLAIFALSRADSLVYLLLAPLVIYEALCLLSLALLLAGRSALTEYSVSSARRLLLAAGALGVFTALVAGGLLVLKARESVAQALSARERVKKEGSAK